jgi:hypothetical protein
MPFEPRFPSLRFVSVYLVLVHACLAHGGRVDEGHALTSVPHEHGVVKGLAAVLIRLQQ